MKIPNYNSTTFAALTDMEQSKGKGKGIHGKNVKDILAELKADEGDDL